LNIARTCVDFLGSASKTAIGRTSRDLPFKMVAFAIDIPACLD